MLTFKHSGNAGDIIYSLPAIKTLTDNAVLFLNLNVRIQMRNPEEHPVGGVQLNETMFKMLKPLLLGTGFIKGVYVYNNEEIDYNLDRFRAQPINLSMGNISRWYSNIVEKPVNLTDPWLNSYSILNNRVVIARSERYLNPNLDYSFLTEFNPLFLGIEKEFAIMARIIKGLEFYPVKNFMEMAQMISGSRLFIGNQSLPYAIAEGLKVRRILETCLYAGNVIPCGGECIEV